MYIEVPCLVRTLYERYLILNHKNNTEYIINPAIGSGLIQTNQIFTPKPVKQNGA